MEPNQRSKIRNANETAKGQTEIPPVADLFQELRARKLKEPSLPKVVAKEKSENEVVLSFSHWTRWLFVAVVGGVLSVFVVNSLESGDGEKHARAISVEAPLEKVTTQKISEQHVAAVMASLKTKYGARDWNSTIPVARRAHAFSIELTDAFMQDTSRPVLVRARLMDIVYGSENIEIIFALPNAQPGQQNYLIISCWRDQLDLFANGVRGVSEYAVVANCYEVRNTLQGCNIIGGLVDAETFSTIPKKQKIARNR